MTRTTSRDYARPHRPWPVWLLDRALTPVPRWGPLTLHPDALIAEAQRAERLTAFGEPDVRVPLGRLCHALETEARLTPMGRIIQHTRLVGALRARLRVHELRRRHPEIADETIAAPIVITGLQRTGTTFLHRLLAADPRVRSFRSWEALQPVPYRGTAGGVDRRIVEARTGARAVSWLAPDFQAVHPIDPEGVEEEVLVLEQTLRSTVTEATCRVPTFSAWLEQEDPLPTYAYLREVLQAAQWLEPRDRWVLKTPHHLEWLDALLTVFPDARVVHTHRDPVTTVASFCSMVAHGQGLCTDHVDPHDVGARWFAKVGRMVDRALATRDARDPATFLDVRYDDLTADPLGEVRRVYAFAGLTLPDDVERRIAETRDASPQHRHGRHVYALEDFGLTRAQVEDRFGTYRARFGLT